MPTRKDVYHAKMYAMNERGMEGDDVVVEAHFVIPRAIFVDLRFGRVLPLSVERKVNDNGDFV